MKNFTIKFSILMFSLVLSIGLFAQNKNTMEEVPLKPLFEMFTSSTCYPCAYANPIIDELMDANPGSHSLIKYQMNWPGAGDPYYTAEGGVRGTYYNVVGVPDLFVNAQDEDPSGVTQEIYDSYQLWTTSLEIEVVTAEIDLDNVISIEANLNALDDYDAGLIAHVVVVEKLTAGNVATNGEITFHNVMMKMLPDASGTILPALSNGSTETLSFTFDMDNTFMETANDLRVIIFVQDDSDQSLIQSEQVEVDHSLDDYTITFNMLDFNSNPVEGASLLLDSFEEQISDVEGMIVYEGVLPGDYTYSAEASGFLPADGEIALIDEDITVDVTFEDPGNVYYYYMDFIDGIPASYTLNVTEPDFIYYGGDGRVQMIRQSGTLQTLMLVTEVIDITPGEKIWFDIGKQIVLSEAVFGTITDPNDPATFVAIDTIIPAVEWETFEYLLEDILPGQVDVYFAWMHNTSAQSHFSLDNIIINYKDIAETYNAYFSVLDAGVPVEGAEITINGTTETTNENGSTLFIELEDGIYNYTITANGYIAYEDEFEVNGSDVFIEVDLLINAIHNTSLNTPKIYPNPAKEEVRISNFSSGNIYIYNINGQLMMEHKNAVDDCTFDISNFENGTYIIKIIGKKEITTSKVIIAK